MEIFGKTAIVTGSSSGIGLAAAQKLLEKGARVIGIDLEENLTIKHDNFLGFNANVTNKEYRTYIFDMLKQSGYTPRILIPCAGITRDALSVKTKDGVSKLYPEEDFNLVLDVNLLSPAYWAMEMIATIQQSDQLDEENGVCVFIGSVSSRGNYGQVAYSASKAALPAISQTFNKEFLSKSKIRSTVVNFGFVDSPMVQKIPQSVLNEKILPIIPIQRLITCEEAASVICSIIESNVITGEIWANGGLNL